MRTRPYSIAPLLADALTTAALYRGRRLLDRIDYWLRMLAASTDRPGAYRGRHRPARGVLSTLDAVAVSVRAQQAEIATLIAEGHRVHGEQTPPPEAPPMYATTGYDRRAIPSQSATRRPVQVPAVRPAVAFTPGRVSVA
jgi:hypothetical protein